MQTFVMHALWSTLIVVANPIARIRPVATTVVVATHDRSVIEYIGSRTLSLENGQVVLG